MQEEPRTQSVKMVTINTMSISTRLPESIRGVHNAIMYSQQFLKWGPFHIYLPSPFSSPPFPPSFRPRERMLQSTSSLSFQFHLYAAAVARPSIISSARSPHNSCQRDGRTDVPLSSPLFPSPAIGIYGCKAGILSTLQALRQQPYMRQELTHKAAILTLKPF